MIGTVNVELEKTIIGEMIRDDGICIEALCELTADNFSDPYARAIFESMSVTSSKGEKIDPVTIQREWNPEQIGTLRNYLVECHLGVISESAYKQHFEQLKELSMIRKAKKETADLFDLFESTTDIEMLRAKATDILNAFDTQSRDKAVDIESGFNNFIENIGKPKNYIKTGISALDYFLKIQKGDFVIVGAKPSQGKTALTLQIAYNMSAFYNVVYFSLETSAEKLYERIVSCATMTDFSKIKQGTLNEQDKRYLIEQQKTFAQHNLKVVNASGMTVSQIQSIAIQQKADIIFIDYIGLIISSGNKKQSSYEKMTQISIDLHTMAQTRNICVFGLCQLNRGGGEEPELHSLRDSGQIEQDADAVLFLHTPNQEDEAHKRLSIKKNKDGETGKITLHFDGNHQRFSSHTSNQSEYTDIPFDD